MAACHEAGASRISASGVVMLALADMFAKPLNIDDWHAPARKKRKLSKPSFCQMLASRQYDDGARQYLYRTHRRNDINKIVVRPCTHH